MGAPAKPPGSATALGVQIDAALASATPAEVSEILAVLAGRTAYAAGVVAGARDAANVDDARSEREEMRAVSLPVAARMTGVELWDLREASRTGELPVIRRRRRIYVRVSTLKSWLRGLESQAGARAARNGLVARSRNGRA